LRGKVHHPLRPESVEGFFQRRPVLDAQLGELEIRVRRQPIEAGLLQGDVIVVIEIVDTQHLVAARQQAQA
jgi:hypothetical protein